jgi:phenylpropionate dioxygenase-like ring-hydroxylating dioxygenase large terminal subunit
VLPLPLAHEETLCAVTDTDAVEFRINTRGKFGVVAGIPLRENWQRKFPDGKAGSQLGFAVYSLWPNTILFSGYIGEHVTRYDPVGADQVRYTARSFARPDLPAEPLAEIIDVLFTRGNHEDVELVEQTQRGLESGFYQPGPLLEGPEAVVRAFQRTIWDAVRPAFA